MNADLAELIKEIGRIANTYEEGVEWHRVADFCEIIPIFEEPESAALNYHQYQLVVDIYAIAYSQCVNEPGEDWGTIKMFANMMLESDRKMVTQC